MKINRLFEITTVLLNRGTIRAQELADHFGVSTRTILRDIDVLALSGVPVVMKKGYGGGISLFENYVMNKTLISEQESESLLFAVKALQATQYPDVDTVLEKMGALFKKAAEHDWVEVDFSHWGSLPNENNKFKEIKKALLTRKVIHFHYVNAEGEQSSRLVEPQKLIFKAHAWYLMAYCRAKEELRTFRVSRLKNLKIMNETFHERTFEATATRTLETFTSPDVALKLRFNSAVLNRVYDDFSDTLIVKHEDGSLMVEVSFPEGEWMYGYILSFGHYVEVIEPQYLRKQICTRLAKTLKLYS